MKKKSAPNAGICDEEPHIQRFGLLAHDILSALSEVVGGVRLLDRTAVDDEGKIQLDRITASGEALARLLETVLADDDNVKVDKKPAARNINLARFLEDTEHRWTGLAREKGIEFKIEKTISLPAIITLDRNALDRIIANLVSNGIKYTDKGQVSLHVSCSAENLLCFKVSDQGRGFSKAAFAQAFEYKGRPTGNSKPGIGMGLFIARDLSIGIGGKVLARNREGGGATVSLCLPHKAWFDRKLLRDQNIVATVSDTPPDLSHLNILLAEDNATNQMVATQMLTAMNAKCQVAADGLEALHILEHETFDIVLLDIEMPRMSGLELIKKIRATPGAKSQMTLIALTAYVMRDHRERIYSSGADGIIAKPLMRLEDLGNGILEFHNRKILDLGPIEDGPETACDDHLPGGTAEVVDRQVFDALVEIIGPDSSLELFGKLQADTESVAQGIDLGRRNLDLKEIRAQTHILISVAGAIGATRLQTMAQRLNRAANQQDAQEIDKLCKSCLTGLADLQDFISLEQDKASPPVSLHQQRS